MSSRPSPTPVRRRLSRVYLHQRPRQGPDDARRSRKPRETDRRTAIICVVVLFISAAIVFSLLAMERNRGTTTGSGAVYGTSSTVAAAHPRHAPLQPLVRLQSTWQQIKSQLQP